MDITSEAARLLTQIGFMAAFRGDAIDARAILDGLQVLRSDSPTPLVGQGIAYMNEGRNQHAIQALSQALEKDERCDFARMLLALANRLCGYDTRSRELCEEIIAAKRDDTSVELAEMLLALPAQEVAEEPTVA